MDDWNFWQKAEAPTLVIVERGASLPPPSTTGNGVVVLAQQPAEATQEFWTRVLWKLVQITARQRVAKATLCISGHGEAAAAAGRTALVRALRDALPTTDAEVVLYAPAAASQHLRSALADLSDTLLSRAGLSVNVRYASTPRAQHRARKRDSELASGVFAVAAQQQVAAR
jgi:hypothetical protein